MQAKTKKHLSALIALVITLSVFGASPIVASAAEPIKVILDGETLDFDVPPAIINDRTMVPMRAIFEALGAEVGWEPSSKTISAVKDNTLVVAIVGDENINVNGEWKTMDVAPVIIDSRTLVPARFVSEALGCDVVWDNNERAVYIYSAQGEKDLANNTEYAEDEDGYTIDGETVFCEGFD